MARRTRVGLVGLGRMGRIHAGNLAGRCPSAQLVCVTDADATVAARVGEDLDVAVAPSLEAMLADSGVDAVAVATPTGSHASCTVRAVQAGKHVFCEKPVSLDRQSTVETVEAVAATGMKLQVGFHRRFDPDWAAAAARIQAGDLGAVNFFRTSLRDMNPPRVEFLANSGGFFVDVTIHDLDTARWLVGEVVEVTAFGSDLADPSFAEVGDIDTAVAVLRFANGALGVIDNSRAARYGYECSTEVVGTRATVRIDNPRVHGYDWLTPGWSSHDMSRDFEQRYPTAYVEELDAFARCIRDDLPPLVTGADALAAFDLAVAADQAWRTGRTVRLGGGDSAGPPPDRASGG